MDAFTNTRITVPGIYAMDADHYHSDPTETPSLSAGMINDLLIAPKKCWNNSRRLNLNYEEDEKQDRFSIGTVSHVMFLEPELFAQKVVIINHDDYRSGAAKAARDAAFQSGLTPILAKNLAKIEEARAVFLASDFTRHAFSDGQFEMAMFWKHPVFGFWCRARPDFMANSGTHMNDYKATASANPEKFGKHAYDMGYHRRAAWYLEGATILMGKRPEHYWFCNQETKAPYLTSVIELDQQALEAGQWENDRAAEKFAQCLETGDWHGYRHATEPKRDLAFQVGLPTYAYIQIEQRA